LRFVFSPPCADYRALHSFPTRRSSDLLVSQAHWGHWLVDDHTEYESTPSNPWHYIIADNVIDPMNSNSIGLVGKYRYNFTGGSEDRKSTRLNSSHVKISYAVFCLKKKR